MWQWIARGNIQQISCTPQTEQHSLSGLCCSVWGVQLLFVVLEVPCVSSSVSFVLHDCGLLLIRRREVSI